MATNFSSINIGQSQQSLSHVSQYDSVAMKQKVKMLIGLGFTDFRVAASTFDYQPGVDISLMIARDILSLGGVVSVGLTTGGHAATQALWDTNYVPAVLQFVRISKILGVHSIYLGNEEEWKTQLNAAQVRTNILNLDALVQPFLLGTNIRRRYDVGQDAQWQYTQYGIGPLDLGLNVYGTDGDTNSFNYHITQTKNALGRDKVIITEWHLHHDWNQIPLATRNDEVLLRDKLQERRQIIEAADIKQAYAFTFDWTDQNDQFAYMKADGKFRLAINAILPGVIAPPPPPPPPPEPDPVLPTHSITVSNHKYCERLSDSNWFNPLNSTIGFWFKSTPQLASRVLQIKGTSLFEIENKGADDGRLLFELKNDQGTTLLANLITSSVYSDNTWHCIVVTFSNGTVKVYKDNVLDNEFTFTPSGTFTFDRSAIGSHVDVTYQYNQGNYCYFKYWGSVLTSADLTRFYEHRPTSVAPVRSITLGDNSTTTATDGAGDADYTLSSDTMWSALHP